MTKRGINLTSALHFNPNNIRFLKNGLLTHLKISTSSQNDGNDVSITRNNEVSNSNQSLLMECIQLLTSTKNLYQLNV